MFNTTILDVAIGMIFIYLLLSLMCSAANEIIELLLKKRAVDLERGIRELLLPNSKSGGDDIVRKLYNHPLLNGLFGGKYEDSKITSKRRYVWRTQLPSYIPARSFALALMDLVGTPKPSEGSTQPPPSGTAGATQVNYDARLQGPPPPGSTDNPLTRLREAIAGSDILQAPATKGAQKALIALVDAAGGDVAKARENIETWYNNSMDRVSSWYKRRAQVTIMILGFFVAITVNVDTITIVKRLATDKALRESLVAASDAYAKANATASPAAKPSPATTTTPPESSAPPAVKPGGKPAGAAPNTPAAGVSPSPSAASTAPPSGSPSAVAANVSSTPTLPAACVKDADSAKCKRAKDLQKACEDPNSTDCHGAKDLQEACKDEDSPKCKYLANLQQIQALGLPIGWDSTGDPLRTWPGYHWRRWWDQIYWHGLGWLLTALALSLGAPFWFDLLNKFIVIRSAVKPHEKSPEEGSKD